MSVATASHPTILTVTFTVQHPTGEPITLTPAPPRIRVWYRYPRGVIPPHAAPKVRQIELRAVGLRAGESLEIHLSRLIGHVPPADADTLLRSVFPTALAAPHGFGWELPFRSAPVLSGEAWSSVGNVGRFRIKYDLKLYRGDRLLAENDPDINLIPDP